jgi:hypothetical protein
MSIDPQRLFFSTVGQGISAWAMMETVLVVLTALLLDTEASKAGIVFYSINFYAWLGIIDDLFKLDKSLEKHEAEWRKISKKLRELNDIRVRLAHHTSWHRESNERWPSLRPAVLDLRTKSQKHQPLDMKEIQVFAEDVVKVGRELTTFISLLPDPRGTWRGKPRQ